MIQPLRRVHARAFLALGIFLTILFIAGVRSRRPSTSSLAAQAKAHTSAPSLELAAVVNGSRVTARVFRQEAGATVEISSSPELLAPDVLVYASTSESKSDVPADAELLGTFASGKTYRLSSNSLRFVILYSLPRKELLATFAAGDER